MKKFIYFLSTPIILSLMVASCDKDNNGDDSGKEYPKTICWAITQVLTAIELENQTAADDEFIMQINEDIKGKLRPIWTTYNFTYDQDSDDEGQLVISFQDSSEKITTRFFFETVEQNTLLSIKHNDGKEEAYRILKDHNYMIKDYTQEYQLLNPRILRAEGIERYTIPR